MICGISYNSDNGKPTISCDEQMSINNTHKWEKTNRTYKCTECGRESFDIPYCRYTCDEFVIKNIIQ
jgi:hypothetical protein